MTCFSVLTNSLQFKSHINHHAEKDLGDDSTDSVEDFGVKGRSVEAMTMTLETSQGTRSPKRKRDATNSGSPAPISDLFGKSDSAQSDSQSGAQTRQVGNLIAMFDQRDQNVHSQNHELSAAPNFSSQRPLPMGTPTPLPIRSLASSPY